jgi:hypothetical protein
MTQSDAAWLAQAQRIAGRPLPARREVPLRYAIGKYFDDVKDFDQAFINFQRANELTKLRRAKHDRVQLTQVVDAITRSYDPLWLKETRINAHESARPVFIVGMLRSGTTLAEQILASHPDVFAAGELTYWNTASAASGRFVARRTPGHRQDAHQFCVSGVDSRRLPERAYHPHAAQSDRYLPIHLLSGF